MTENFLYILDLSFSDHEYKQIIYKDFSICEETALPDTLMQADAMPCRLRANSKVMKCSPNANTEIKQNITLNNKMILFNCSLYSNQVFL